jgi:SAM-dependent methyltransferase
LRPAEYLWGEGFLVPGGPVQLRELVKPLHLRRGSNLVDLAAGLGGAARFIARATGAWVVGLERSPELAALAMAGSEGAGLGKQAPIRVCNPNELALARGAFDAALGRFATWELPEREKFLRAVAEGLAAGGRLLLVDLVQRAPGAALDRWRETAGAPSPLWTREQYADCLRGAGFGVHFAIDVTAPHRALIREGWDRLARSMAELPADILAETAAEAQRWQAQAAALDEGSLGVGAIFAVR